jgi:ribose/xylose/arabinose/galactoside ABC-type transport system permease subunit
MIYTKIGLSLLVIIAVTLVVLAFTSTPGLKVPLVVILALAVLVGGGNWLNHSLGIQRKAQEFERPERDHEEP